MQPEQVSTRLNNLNIVVHISLSLLQALQKRANQGQVVSSARVVAAMISSTTYPRSTSIQT
jgi:hypothetical protein